MTYTQPIKIRDMKRMNKIEVVHIHNGMLFSHEKGRYSPICNNMDGFEYIMLSELSQTERQRLYGITYMCNLKKLKPEET